MKTFLLFLLLGTALLRAVDISAISSNDENNSQDKVIEQRSIFGANLFNGNFTKSSQHIYNPDYRLAIGDVVTVKMWGAFEYEQPHTVDSQGNIFIPRVGVIHLLGVKNGELSALITAEVKKVYRNNVYVYADMGAYQNVSVFVTGNVNKPGLYQGLSSDSLLQYLDKASGINLKYGSFRRISVLRDNRIYKNIDLYDFLLQGQMDMFAFRTGDVILVESVGAYISASGDVQRPFRFESKGSTLTLSELAQLSGLKPTATNAVVKTYASNNQMQVQTYPISTFNTITLRSGDSADFMSDYSTSVVQISIDGEHEGLHTLIVPRGTTLAKVKSMLQLNSQSNVDALQIYRQSVAQMQKQLIDAQLRELETLALTTSSVSPQEASVRASESKSTLEFIERARKVEPRGRVVINEKTPLDTIVMEEGDTIVIPAKTNIVVVQGEVGLPGAFTYVAGNTLDQYIEMAGDLNERANTDRILVIRANGKAEKYDDSMFASNDMPTIERGDAILVLPKADGKNLQFASVITQILYQIAIATSVVIGL